MNNKKVIVAGHLCVDITPGFPANFKGSLANIMLPGKLTNVEGLNIHTGGVVANTGMCMQLLGAEVELMGKVGHDALGHMIEEDLSNSGVKTNLIYSDDSNTSYSIVLAIPGHDRTILHSPGTNDTFVFDDLDMDSISNAALFHFGYPPLMRQLYANDGAELVKIMKNVDEAGPVTSLDMAAIDPQAPVGQIDWYEICQKVMPYTDIFAPSVEEIMYMIDRDKFWELNNKAAGKDVTSILDIEKDVKPLADKLIAMGASIVLIKCGVAGLYYQTGSKEAIGHIEKKLGFSLDNWSNRQGFEKSFVPDKVLSAIGAGDTTIGAFLTSLLLEYPLENCVAYATAEGASCVEGYDTFSGLRTLKEIQDKIADGWKKL